MMPVGLLMKEHRTIERMVRLIAFEARNIEGKNRVDLDFITQVVDFMSVYADCCHHGKEEDILFKVLEQRQLSPDHHRVLSELSAEHLKARSIVKSLHEAKEKYVAGDITALAGIKNSLAAIAAFYPRHIEKEDKHFFLPIMAYLSADEKKEMLYDFHKFDMSLIHEKYKSVVTGWERSVMSHDPVMADSGKRRLV
jgi:hemerythrin-like domain-containing protein